MDSVLRGEKLIFADCQRSGGLSSRTPNVRVRRFLLTRCEDSTAATGCHRRFAALHGQPVCETLKTMARAVAKYVFAALLALLSTQAAVPSVRLVAGIEIVWCTEAEQQTPREARLIRADIQAGQPVPTYVSRTRPEPDAAVLFQRHYFLARDAEKLRRSADDLQGLRQCQRILPHVAARGAGERARGEA